MSVGRTSVTDLAGLQLLRRIEEGVAGKSGEAFFRQIVRDLTIALDAHAAFTSRLLPGRKARMLAFWVNGRYEKCLEYSLAGTPCEFVYRGEITAFARDIGNVFPVDRAWFEELGVHSYLGLPIVSESGEVHGHLAVMDRPERDWREADVDVLRLFSLRTAVELERARAQALLEESNESLRRMNEQLTAEIARRVETERQLAAAKMAAESANQAKSVFIRQMSHELRTPLNGILGYAQLLRRAEALTEQQRDGLAVIERSGEHLLNLVNDLLDLAKIEAGRLELREENVDLSNLLQHVIDLVRVRADKAQLRFAVELPAALPVRVRGDSRALRQVLLNLLGNAVKFTDAGGCVTLKVELSQPATATCHLVFEISDTGIGIPADQLQRIFEPFHRIEHDARRAEGTGLGLAITHCLVEAMQGSIVVRSEPGRGTTFRVEFELPVQAFDQERSRQDRCVTGYDGPRRSVLIADDDAASRALIADLLAGLGFNVRSAIDGASALEQWRRSAADLLITDLMMPRVNGIELTRALRESDAGPLRILAVSASASEFTSQEALAAGADAFLPKPLCLQMLLDRIAELLQLEWRYADVRPSAHARAAAGEEFSLEPAIADELYHLAMLGDITSLLERARQTLGDNPSAEPFCAELKSLASQYDTGAIRSMLKSHAP
jgi:signal transduction histidine kinase/CheY-like chemotaxis protein